LVDPCEGSEPSQGYSQLILVTPILLSPWLEQQFAAIKSQLSVTEAGFSVSDASGEVLSFFNLLSRFQAQSQHQPANPTTPPGHGRSALANTPCGEETLFPPDQYRIVPLSLGMPTGRLSTFIDKQPHPVQGTVDDLVQQRIEVKGGT
jgi:hypothetical protein